MKHNFLIIACVIFIFSLLGVYILFPLVRENIVWGMFLLFCPIMHIFMHRSHGHTQQENQHVSKK